MFMIRLVCLRWLCNVLLCSWVFLWWVYICRLGVNLVVFCC